MKKISLTFVALIIGTCSSVLVSQSSKIKPEWQVELSPFFDNTEFARSRVQHDQTMAAVRLSPEIGLSFDTVHRVRVGISLLQEFGSTQAVDNYTPIAYYEYNKAPYRFLMGAFPRTERLKEYPRAFFQDSVLWYRPVLTGFLWEVYNDLSYFNLWLDWTGRQTETQREAFFAGWSGRYQKNIFFAQLFGYMFHYAKTKNPPVDQFIHDNGLAQLSVGLDFKGRTPLTELKFSAGYLGGLEDNRGTTSWLRHDAFVADLQLEYRRLGLQNSFYAGDPQMYFYPAEGNHLYWGDPFYRSDIYNRSDIYLKLIDSPRVKTKLQCSLHATEDGLFFEQGLFVQVKIGN
ncbi:MAG: hypothetical protein LBR81_03765 [Prevotellaceae bacterium]|jgi:hypothetical protein|nr:hypothetical protein [Prevotellaceae bacterium]